MKMVPITNHRHHIANFSDQPLQSMHLNMVLVFVKTLTIALHLKIKLMG
jgi:hypothetical protein